MSFREFMEQKNHGWAEAMLIQAIAALSTQPQFSHMTPEEIFNHVDKTRQRVQGE